MKKSPEEEFIEKAIKIHGGLYDYSRVSYVDSKTKIEIICQKHGTFFQKPNNHLNGNGCTECYIKNRTFSKEEFIDKANIKHNNKYDYSIVDYINSESRIKIICKEHGIFCQKANNHVRGGGCRKCAISRQSCTKTDFINKSNLKHGNKYDYSKVEYSNSTTKVEIICQKHGSFWQTPKNHLLPHDCPGCSRNRLSREEFLRKAFEAHGDLYDYSKVEYSNLRDNITIKCQKHGDFTIRGKNHLYSSIGLGGCQKCSGGCSSKKENRWLDSLGIFDRQIKFKIGDSLYKVDGFDPKTNTIYEFLGDYWHGNLEKYKGERLNVFNKKTMKQLNEETIRRIQILEKAGYNVIYIWENEFDTLCVE